MGTGTGGWATTGRLWVRVVGIALGTTMISDTQSPSYVGLKPTWKGNLCLLLLVAMIAGVSIFALIGGNVTGVSLIPSALGGKQLGVLRMLVPAARSIVYLVNATNPNSEHNVRSAQQAALALGLQIHILNASTESEIDAAFQVHADALAIAPDSFFIGRSNQLVALAAGHSVPTIYPFRDFTAAGGLVSYGVSLPDLYRQVGVYTGKILRGAGSANMSVLQPTKFELVINLKTAQALNLVIPPAMLAIADEVIE